VDDLWIGLPALHVWQNIGWQHEVYLLDEHHELAPSAVPTWASMLTKQGDNSTKKPDDLGSA
jgi:hypothetical protein